MKASDLQIPALRRNANEPVVHPPDLEFAGNNLQEFVDDIQSTNKHYTAEQIKAMRASSKILGKAVHDPALGQPFGTAFGRFWYMIP